MEDQLLAEWAGSFPAPQNPKPHGSPSLVAALALVQLCKLNPFPALVYRTAKLIPVPAQGGGVVQLEARGAAWMALPFPDDTD